jgi:hypothetical protein
MWWFVLIIHFNRHLGEYFLGRLEQSQGTLTWDWVGKDNRVCEYKTKLASKPWALAFGDAINDLDGSAALSHTIADELTGSANP